MVELIFQKSKKTRSSGTEKDMNKDIRLLQPRLLQFLLAISIKLAFFISVPATALASGLVNFPVYQRQAYVVTSRAETLEHRTATFGSSYNIAVRPLVLRDAEGNHVRDIISNLDSIYFSLAFGFFDWMDFSLTPSLVQASGWYCAPFSYSWFLADLRLALKVQLLKNRSGWNSSLQLNVDIPPMSYYEMSKQKKPQGHVPTMIIQLTQEREAAMTPVFVLGYQSKNRSAGFELGYTLRRAYPLATMYVGHELLYGVAGQIRLHQKLPEFVVDLRGRIASPWINNRVTPIKEEKWRLPLEVITAVKWTRINPQVTAGVGMGLLPEYGTPQSRIFIALSFRTPKLFLRSTPKVSSPTPLDDEQKEHGGHGAQTDAADQETAEPITRPQWHSPRLKQDKDLVVLWCDRIEIREQIQFSFDSAVIDTSSHPLLDEVADTLKAHPDIIRVTIVGHADDSGSQIYNIQLSQRRAAAVKGYLIQAGVTQVLEIRGLGSLQPLDNHNSEAARTKNRRVEFLLEEAPQ